MLTEAACNGFNIVHAGNEGREDSADSGVLSLFVSLLTHFLAVMLATCVCRASAATRWVAVCCSLSATTGKGSNGMKSARRHVDTHIHWLLKRCSYRWSFQQKQVETGRISLIVCVCFSVRVCVKDGENEQQHKWGVEGRDQAKQGPPSGFVNNKTQVSLTRSVLKERKDAFAPLRVIVCHWGVLSLRCAAERF